MNGHPLDIQPGCVGNSFGDGVGNIMEFEIQKNLNALVKATSVFISPLMAEVSFSRKYHSNPRLIGDLDHFWVSTRTSRLNHGSDSCFDGGFDTVWEREERI